MKAQYNILYAHIPLQEFLTGYFFNLFQLDWKILKRLANF